MDLTSLYRMVSAEAPSVPEQMMRGAANQAALQQADEQLMANKRLRDLYSSGGQPSMQDLMSIDPRLGIEMQQAQFKNMLEAGQIEKLNREKDEADAKVYAEHIAPIAQDYFDDIKKGMPEQQAEYKFRSGVGSAQSQIQQQFGIKPKVDFTQFAPLQIAQRAHALGVDIPHLKELEAQQQSQLQIQLKGAPSFSDKYFTGPDGRLYPNPYYKTGGQPQDPYAGEAPYNFTLPSGQAIKVWDLGSAAEAVHQLTNPADKEAATKWLDEQWSSKRNPAMPPTKQELEIKTAAEKVKAEAGAKEEIQQGKMEAAFDKQHLIDLINESTPGGVAEYGTKATQFATLSTPWSRADKKLKIDSAALTQSIPRFEGPQSDKDTAAYREAAGDLANPSLPRKDRIAAVDEMDRLRKKYEVKHGKKETSNEAVQGRRKAAIDMLNKGEIDEVKFKQLWDMP